MNSVGLAAALAAFLGIWIGHVAVRRVEAAARRLWMPVLSALALGFGSAYGSLWIQSRAGSAALGILGVTFLWDAFELVRQEKRIQHGHAPANPDNPRHAHMLAAYPGATTIDLLKRGPAGLRPSATIGDR